MSPQRIQLRRSKGWRKPPGTVTVARPTRWGNPFVIGKPIPEGFGEGIVRDRAHAVDLYHQWARRQDREFRRSVQRELGGKDLACWCPLGQPCHADVLLSIANGRDVPN